MRHAVLKAVSTSIRQSVSLERHIKFKLVIRIMTNLQEFFDRDLGYGF